MTKNKQKNFLDIPEIKHVVHSNKVCTILWVDGTKTQSVCHPEDEYNKDTGFLVAFLKKFMSTEQIIELLEKWSHLQPKQEDVQKEKAIKKSKKRYYAESDLDEIIPSRANEDNDVILAIARARETLPYFTICEEPLSFKVFY